MAKYNVAYACGHEGVVQLYGKNSERERKLDWMAGNLCPDCWAKEKEQARKEHNESCAKSNTQAGLPALEGSEKQIAWAESIRNEALTKLFAGHDEWLAKAEKIKADEDSLDTYNHLAIKDGYKDFDEVFRRLLTAKLTIRNEVSARWWIDNRETLVANPKKMQREIARASMANEVEKTPEAVAAKTESTLRPEQPITETVAEIKVDGKEVEVVFTEKREDFWGIIKKQMQYSWSGNSWKRQAGLTCRSAADLAAETGNTLLQKKFIVRCFDAQIRQMMLDASFEPENSKLISRRVGKEYQGWFAIQWARSDGDFYKAARQITGSKYSGGCVMVAPEHFEQMLDFAEMYGFKFSPGAQDLVQEARAAKETTVVVNPAKPPAKDKADTSRPKLDPATAGTIDLELIDAGQ